MRKLYLDIETSPHQAYVWNLRDENVGLSQLIETSRVLCVAHRLDGGRTRFSSEWQPGGREAMLEDVHDALDEADAVVHYNGASFDEPHLNREFLLAGMPPPARYRTIDVYRTVKSRFRFASSRLEQVARQLEIRQGKLKTNFGLWKGVLAGDEGSRRRMERYNREDVALLAELYGLLLPWIDRHPNAGLYEGDDLMRCTRCGSQDLTRNGFAFTAAGRFQRYACRECGGQSRGTKRVSTTPLREA